jgi:hypothetical protein
MNMTNTYIRLTEANEWEGETWHFYLPIADNSAALAALQELIDSADNDFGFSLSETFTEDEVDTLVRTANGDTSYLAAHTKLAGRLTPIDDLEKLYKGQIVDFFSDAS